MPNIPTSCIGIVQARISSQRFPGKVLAPILGKPLLLYLLERLSRSKHLSEVVVATSTEPSDDPLELFCKEQGVRCYRGSLIDPSARIAEALMDKAQNQQIKNQSSYSYFARICGDSPLYDADVLDRAIEIAVENRLDIATNVNPRSYPKGQSVEIIRTQFFLDELPKITSLDDREHVTRAFYRGLIPAKYENLSCPEGDLSQINFCVDYQEDLLRIQKILAKLAKPHVECNTAELISLYRELEESARKSETGEQ